MTTPQITHTLEHHRKAGSPAWLRPILMESLIRGGSHHADVTEAFQATPEERERLDDLLAGPAIWQSTRRAA